MEFLQRGTVVAVTDVFFLIFRPKDMLKLCLNFSESKTIYAYKRYAYKKRVYPLNMSEIQMF